MPQLCVLIPVLNSHEGLIRSLESLARSTYNDFDTLIIDDGSNPIIKVPDSISSKINIIIHRNYHNMGIEYSLNKGLEYIISNNYKYIARLDACDECTPYRIERQVTFLKENPDVALVGSHVYFMDTNHNILYAYRVPIYHNDIINTMHLKNAFFHPAVMYTTEAIRTIGFYKGYHEDYDLFIRIAQKYKVRNLDEILTFYELTPTGKSLSNRRLQLKTRIYLQLDYFEWKNVYSYIGIIRSLIMLMIPSKLARYLKSLVNR